MLQPAYAGHGRAWRASRGLSSFGYSGTIAHAVLHQDLAVASAIWISVCFPASKLCLARITVARVRHGCTAHAGRLWLPRALLQRRSYCSSAVVRRVLTVLWMRTCLSDRNSAATGCCIRRTHAAQLAACARSRTSADRQSVAPCVVLLTCGTQAAGAIKSRAAAGAAHGGVWGFARVLRLEHASLRAQSIDVSHRARVADALSVGSPAEAETALGEDGRYVARLRAHCSSSMSIGWQTVLSGRYVITGGLGGLGLRAASLLVTRGVIEAKLASRSGRVTRDGQAELRSLGSSAKVVACDGANSSDARFLFSHAVSGVLHAAGMLNDRGSLDRSWCVQQQTQGRWRVACA